MLDVLKIIGNKLLWVVCFFCIGSGVFGAIIILRDTIKQGAYTRSVVLLHSAYLVIGYFILKELLK